MTRVILRPACLQAIDARALADAFITQLEQPGGADAIDAYVAAAETASPWLTPTIISPTPYQQLWRLRFFTQTLELSTTRVIEQLVRALGCDFIDVGAHVGYFSILADQAGASAVVSIEMHPPNWRLLKVNVPSARHVLAAAGEAAGSADYFVGQGHTNHSLALRHDTSQTLAKSTVTTLDSLMTTGEGALVVKIDVQGYENRVLRGFNEGLRSRRPILIVDLEHNDRGSSLDSAYLDTLGVLEAHDYRVFSIQDRELVEVKGAHDPLLGKLSRSSNAIAIAATRFNQFETALHLRRFDQGRR
jgi:FkbM family methyltransferase